MTTIPMPEAKHLWEYDHPYYCEEGNFYKVDCHDKFESWAEFTETLFHGGDRDLNLLFRWDWKLWGGDDVDDLPEGERRHELLLFFVLQRKAILCSASIDVTPEDEPAVREWLAECAKTITALWEPFDCLAGAEPAAEVKA